MQFNSFLFPGPGMHMNLNYNDVIYIPRNKLKIQQPKQEFREAKFSFASKQSYDSNASVGTYGTGSGGGGGGGGFLSCMCVQTSNQNNSPRGNKAAADLKAMNKSMGSQSSYSQVNEFNEEENKEEGEKIETLPLQA